MSRSIILLHHHITSSFIKQIKSNLKLGLLITFHYHTLLCNCERVKPSSHTSVVQMAEQLCTGTNSSSVFVGSVDRHKGVHIKSAEEPCGAATFSSKLEASLKQWTVLERTAVWFQVSLEQADWVPVLAKNGFRFHHTSGGEVAMVRWMSAEPSRIPVYAHTLVGAGALVINSKDELLVVQETFRDTPYWKLPGGYVEPGENIPDAAMREVMEETNIKTEFRSMVAFRHTHSAPFGCSDIYFIVELTPVTETITSCEQEIEDCQWMGMETFMNHPSVHENNRLFLRKYLFGKEKGVSINGTRTLHPVTKSPQMLFAIGSLE